jgi:hypothetical protein
MDGLPGLESLILAPLAEVFFINMIDEPIWVEAMTLGEPFQMGPMTRVIRKVNRGTSIKIITSYVSYIGNDIWWIFNSNSIVLDTDNLLVPIEAGNVLVFGWDGVSWIALDPNTIHDHPRESPRPRLLI